MGNAPDALATPSGYVRPLALRAQDVRVEDIAHALAQRPRFGGFGRFPYSVAQHCCLGTAVCVHRWPERPELALAFLHHDATEAYLPTGDTPRPIKGDVFYRQPRRLTDFRGGRNGVYRVGPDVLMEPVATVEARMLSVIYRAVGVPFDAPPPEVDALDKAVCVDELADLFPAHGFQANDPPVLGYLAEWPWEMARERFIDWHTTLTVDLDLKREAAE